MIEETIYNYLKTKTTIPVYMEYPTNPPGAMVILEKVGASLEDHVHGAIIAVQSYDESLYKTASLNEVIKSAMLNCIEIDKIVACSLNSDYNYPDKDRNQYRYQALFEIKYIK